MAISSLQNKNNININNYKIRNNNKNNLNYNDIKIVDKKNLTQNNFFVPKYKKDISTSYNIEETLSNDIPQLNMKNIMHKENNNMNSNNELKNLKIKYEKWFNEYQKIKNYCNKINQNFISEKKKFINTINKLATKNKKLESLISKEMVNDLEKSENINKMNDNNVNNENENIEEKNNCKNVINDLKSELESKIEKIKEYENTIEYLNNKIKELSQKNILQTKKENLKSTSLISDEEDDDNNINNEDIKKNKGYAKLYSNLTKKSELLTQKEKEFASLLEKLNNMEKEMKEKENIIFELSKEKNKKIEELGKNKEEYMKLKKKIKSMNEENDKKDKILKEKDDTISLNKIKINELEKFIKGKEAEICKLNKEVEEKKN